MNPSNGWDFVSRHMRVINFMSRKYVPANVEIGDFRQEVALYVAARADRYDPSLGSPSTWIGFQARAVRTTMRRRHTIDLVKARRAAVQMVALRLPADAAAALETHAEVSVILDRASAPHREACERILRDLNRSEIRAEYGIAPQTMDLRIERLAHCRRQQARERRAAVESDTIAAK